MSRSLFAALLLISLLSPGIPAGVNEKSWPYGDELRTTVSEAKARIEGMPREQAARAARELVNVEANLTMERNSYRTLLARFVEQYAATDAALPAQVDLLTDRIGPPMIDALDAFVGEHANIAAAAKALYLKGFHPGHNAFGSANARAPIPLSVFPRVRDLRTAAQRTVSAMRVGGESARARCRVLRLRAAIRTEAHDAWGPTTD